MREIEILLKPLVNVDRPTLIAVLSTEAHTASKLAMTARQRTPLQRAKRQAPVERAGRLDHILAYFRDGRAVRACRRRQALRRIGKKTAVVAPPSSAALIPLIHSLAASSKMAGPR